MPFYHATFGADSLIADDQDDTFFFEPGMVQANNYFDAAGGVDRMFLTGDQGDFSGFFDFRPATVLGFEGLEFSGVNINEIFVSFNHTQVGAEFSVVGRGNGLTDYISVYLSPNASFSAAGWTFTNWDSDGLNIIGAEGAEIIVGSQVTDGVAAESGDDTIYGGDGNDTLDGGDGDDVLDGGNGGDVMIGGDGDDRFAQTLDSAVDVIFGGDAGADAGFDTIDYSAADGGVIVQLSGYTTGSGGALLATFSGLEGAVGTNFDDALIGNAANNRIEGRLGADWLVGQGGDDWFVQGIDASVDRLFGDAGSDTIDFGAASAGVVVQLTGWSTINGGALLATFTGMENASGTAFNDALIGNALDNRITGGLGADWLVGQGGNDWFVQANDTSGIDRLFGGLPGADSGVDTIDYAGASAGVVVQLSGYATTNFGGPPTTLATFAGIEDALGTAFNDALIGNAGNNRLTGGTGGDWLVGGLGADTFVYQSISDGAGDSIRDFSQAQLDRIDLAAIDANPLTGGDDAFSFSSTRTADLVGEAVVTNFGGSSLLSLYIDADNIADMTIPVVHQQGTVMNASDFVL